MTAASGMREGHSGSRAMLDRRGVEGATDYFEEFLKP